MKIKISGSYELTNDDINDILTTAIEGGINYWATIYKYIPGTAYAEIKAFEEEGVRIIDKSVIGRGVQLLADGYAKNDRLLHIVEFIENHDANDASSIVQLGLFGEVRF